MWYVTPASHFDLVLKYCIYFLIMADKHLIFVSMPVMKPVSQTIAIFPASGTFSGFCPATVPERFKLTLPYLTQVILIDISLYK